MQSSRRTLVYLVAALFAAFTIISVRNRLAQSPVETPAASSRLMVAKHDIAPGTFVQGEQDLDWENVPMPAAPAGDNAAPETYLHEGAVKLTDFNGAVARRQLHAGDAVAQSALMKSGEGGFMSAVLDPGMRAVSIAVNATSGNAGFVSPGDRLDLIVTHRIKMQKSGTDNTNDESVVSETFVRNVRVVAVDQMLDNPDNKAILAKTVTVEVSPRQAEQISVAAEMGKISVALRSITTPAEAAKTPANPAEHVLTDLYGAAPNAESESTTRDSDISQLLERHNTVAPRVQVIRGDQVQNLDFYQDAQ